MSNPPSFAKESGPAAAAINVRSMRGGAVVPDGAVRIDRKTRWGNPFPMATEADRARVIERYRHWLEQQVASGQIGLADLAGLHGRPLYCWCAPRRCHGHVLAQFAAAAHAVLNEGADPARAPWLGSGRPGVEGTSSGDLHAAE